jgi:ferrochelatase
LLELTQQQAQALEKRLNAFGSYKVFIAMRYWHPFTAEAMQQVRASGATEVVLLPLYPQYSRTTSTSSLAEWKRLARQHGVDKIPTRITLPPWRRICSAVCKKTGDRTSHSRTFSSARMVCR